MSYRRLIEASEESPLTDDYDESNENIKEFECHVSFFVCTFSQKKERKFACILVIMDTVSHNTIIISSPHISPHPSIVFENFKLKTQ